MNKNRLFITAIILSIALHLLTSFGLFLAEYNPPKVQEDPFKNAVELVDAETLKKLLKDSGGQIVEQNEKALNDEIPEDAKFLSKNNQKVVQETKAAKSGKYKNTNDQHTGPKPTSQKQMVQVKPPQQIKPNKGKTFTTQKNSPVALPKLVDLKPSFKPGETFTQHQPKIQNAGGAGPSQTDDYLKDVKTGLQTLLSTREFVYYSYYSRIKNKLRQYWEPMIKEKITRLLRSGRSIASSSNRVTNLVITLDQKGHLVKVQVVGESGVRDLDDAAIEAFEEAAPFPNPPKGIVEQDGTIKIRWDFILEA